MLPFNGGHHRGGFHFCEVQFETENVTDFQRRRLSEMFWRTHGAKNLAPPSGCMANAPHEQKNPRIARRARCLLLNLKLCLAEGRRRLKKHTMSAETLNCPMCGAAARTDATHCEHCGSRLATVACPSCFGMMFVGSKFCSHCGARADRTEIDSGKRHSCPRCKAVMEAVMVGQLNFGECPKCHGIWADADTLEQLCADREKQAAVLGVPTYL